jgi:8-oxo-dGTP pyrophosphatase MutT (NUDIX family)
VKCVLKRDGQVLLVRHTYGPDRWELPGGGVKRREEPSAAARREVHEELSIDVEEWRYLGELFARVDGKRDRVWCFSCEIGDGAIEPDHVEIAEAHWFAHDRLPPDRARHVARILEMQA